MYSDPVQRIVTSFHDHASMDPDGELLDRAGLSDDDLAEIADVMRALQAWKAEEARASKASSDYMELSERDMQALRLVMGGARIGAVVTPAMVAEYLGLTSAAVTKMLDRLQTGGHVVRSAHPSDRRGVALTVTPSTQQSARGHVGVQHAGRFAAAARLSSAERRVVTRFLADLAQRSADGPDGTGHDEPTGGRPDESDHGRQHEPTGGRPDADGIDR
ncbi:MarR family winged helix-turn-helix transcriptional regulator [Georgenia sp. Z1344]|uniref:MarR family winged helix-turn-helix transcriptional regulator n=1 Tax=Georgenia sp. Z1344 TaxID=3416706 RepID=UPI003CF06697